MKPNKKARTLRVCTVVILIGMSSMLSGQAPSELPELKSSPAGTNVNQIYGASAYVHEVFDIHDSYFQVMLDGYITGYGLSCSTFLAPDKVEWVLNACKTSDATECRKQEVHTKIYVDRNLYTYKQRMAKQLRIRPETDLQQAINDLYDSGKRKAYVDLWNASVSLAALNGCQSPALRRFQDNLVRFGEGLPLIPPSVPPATPRVTATSPPLPADDLSFPNTDYPRLLNDVIDDDIAQRNREQRSSVFRDLDKSSMSNFKIARQDTGGRPRWIQAQTSCRYDSESNCGLTLVMSNGLPTCLVWSTKQDLENYCFGVSVSQELRGKFLNGAYNKSPAKK